MSGDVSLEIPSAFAEIAAKLPPLSTAEELSEIVHIPENTLNDWRSKGKNLKFVKLGRAVYYRRDDVLAFLESSVYSSTADAKKASVRESAA